MVTRGHHIDHAGLQFRRIECHEAYWERGVSREDLLEMTGVARVEMLRQDNRGREPRGQGSDKG
jgi:hypothetical protein